MTSLADELNSTTLELSIDQCNICRGVYDESLINVF